jgi:hypothetical protein
LWIMNTDSQMPDDVRLRVLLCESRTEPELPPGFQKAVWRRIERAETKAAALRAADWLDALAAWFLRPRRAFTTAAVVLLVGLSLGIVQGASHATDVAKARYLDSVSPSALRQ